VFNLLTSPPAASASQLCPKTGAPHRLVQRPDDNEATVAERLRVYDEKTRPLVDFYRARGLLRVIDAQAEVGEVTRRLYQALGVRMARKARPAKAARRSPRRAARKGAARPKAANRRAAPRRKPARPASRASASRTSRAKPRTRVPQRPRRKR
jgi:hypothetical protein